MSFDDSWNGIVKEYLSMNLRNYEIQWTYDGIEYYLEPAEYDNIIKYDLWDTKNQITVSYDSAIEALTTAIISNGKTAKDLYEAGLISFDIL